MPAITICECGTTRPPSEATKGDALRQHAWLSARRRHWEMLAVGIVVPVIALLLEVQGGSRVAFWLLPEYPLPESCPMRSLLKLDCPGCGLTRSLVYLMHGELKSSFALHHVGWLMGLMLIGQIPYRWIAIYRKEAAPFGVWFARGCGMLLMSLLIGDWIWRVAQRALG